VGSTLNTFDLFWANKDLNKIAIICGELHMSYKILQEKVLLRSQELAIHKINDEGLLVVIRRSNKLNAIIDVLSCLKLGFGFLNLPNTYPEERVTKIKDIAGPYAVITDESCTVYETYKTYNEDLAYMIFTSGTTGEPKGVMISNKNLLSFLEALQNTIPTSENTTMLQFASFSFDASIWEIFSTLCYGGTLVLTPENVVLLSDNLADFILDNNVNRALLTPVVARTIVSKNMDTMTDLFIGGDAFHQSILDDWNETYNLWNAYGPTEATVCVIVHKFKKKEQIVLGKALYKNKLSINHEELIIQGDQVALGHVSSDGIILYNGIYNTGDIVSLNENDDFIFHGRKDDQIKIRGGYRVSLQEIKKTVESLAEVRCAYVLAYLNGDTKEMCCFFEGELKEKELQMKIANVLPFHMIPSMFIHVEEWPLNSSGKIDRNKLLEMIPFTKSNAAFSDLAKLIGLWKESLRTDSVDEFSNFFQLGGQSFQALQIMQRYINDFGLSMELIDFFKNPTPAEQIVFFSKK
jgi:fengycin family lipopeptide synthetase D/tyrocidine synthetase-3